MESAAAPPGPPASSAVVTMRSRVSGVAGACLRLTSLLSSAHPVATLPKLTSAILHRRIAGVTFYSVEFRESEMTKRGQRSAGADGLERRLAATLAKYDARPDTGSVRFALASPARGWRWEWASPAASGGANPAGHYFIASTTKLYVTALVLQLRAEGRLDLRGAGRLLPRSRAPGRHPRAPRRRFERAHHRAGTALPHLRHRRLLRAAAPRRQHADRQGARTRLLVDARRRAAHHQGGPRAPVRALHAGQGVLLGHQLPAAGCAHRGRDRSDLRGRPARARSSSRSASRDTYPFTAQTLDRYADVDAMLYGTQPDRHPTGDGLGARRRRHRLDGAGRHRLPRGVHAGAALPA